LRFGLPVAKPAPARLSRAMRDLIARVDNLCDKLVTLETTPEIFRQNASQLVALVAELSGNLKGL
jgi:hypothetical protein